MYQIKRETSPPLPLIADLVEAAHRSVVIALVLGQKKPRQDDWLESLVFRQQRDFPARVGGSTDEKSARQTH
jgi:hypothetical protein